MAETKWRKGGKKEGRVVQERVTGGRKVRTMLNLLFIYIFVFFVPRLVMAMIGGTTPPARCNFPHPPRSDDMLRSTAILKSKKYIHTSTIAPWLWTIEKSI